MKCLRPDAARAFLMSICLLAMALAGCGKPRSQSASAMATVRVTGASTVYPIVQMAGEVLRDKGALRVEAQAGGSTRGFEDTLAGRNDLGAIARDLTAEESSQVKSIPIAYDGVGIVVNSSQQDLKGLTTADLRKIYRKEITDWSKLGGKPGKIVTVNKASGHATLKVFLKHVKLEAAQVKSDVVAGDNAQVLRVVASTEGAIGYVSMGEAIHAAEIGMKVTLVSLDGVEPTLAAVAAGSYPIFRTLYLISNGELKPGAATLVDFLASDEGRQIIADGKYIPMPK